ncbi:MAG: aconitate hydratase [Phycisphaerae bacterium]|nr:aconitate hydratase [Phycisphaerae bacterium]
MRCGGKKDVGLALVHRIIQDHLIEGQLRAGSPVGVRIDQTLTQDATGTTVFLLYESMGDGRVSTDLSVSYVDHNLAGFGPENHNDHLYLQTVAARTGVWFSRPGNGICHQVHLERFGRPGATLLGSDSHTPTCGGMGMLAIGAGGLDVAVAMAGGPFYLTCPKVIGVRLTGRLGPWVAAKDVILAVLGVLTTQGNVGCVVEYTGPGVQTLSVPQRATITNMGAELGVTTSLFPSDEQTRRFLAAQGREHDYRPLAADPDAEYDRVLEVNLSEVEPLGACPSSPDRVRPVAQIAGTQVGQVAIGSCTNSSLADLMTVARVLKGRRVHPTVELAIAPGSRQVLGMLAGNGCLADLIAAGARILESGCGPCIGQGFSPADGVVTLRTFNRNFAGRTGTQGDQVYLVSPETAVAAALTGRITDPRDLPGLLGIEYPQIGEPDRFAVDDGMLVEPLPKDQACAVEVLRGPTIVVPEAPSPLPDRLDGEVLLRCGDRVTTDHIMPAGAFLKLRSNVPKYAMAVFNSFNEPGRPTFAQRALELKARGRAGIVVAGESYGQGSSREHAALCPMVLGVRVVLAKGIERIHRGNLINFCIVPIVFADPADYDLLAPGDGLVIEGLRTAVAGQDRVRIAKADGSFDFVGTLDLSDRERGILLADGLLNYTRGRGGAR